MLQTFRDYSGSIFVKILLGVLVASFALWGVGDIFRNFTSMRPVATVGDSSISQEDFVHAYQRTINNLQNASRGKLTLEQLKAFKVHQQVLEDLINTATIDNQVKGLGLMASDAAVRQNIQSIPAFHDSKGQFDRQKFLTLISGSGTSEAGLINDVRQNILKIQLIGGISFGITLPQFYTDMLYRGLEEKRVFNVVQIPLTSIKLAETPTDSDLEQLYNQNQESFTRPETRQISLLVLDPKVQQGRITVSNEQLQQEFEARKKELGLPEKRDVVQLTFIKREEAQKALEALRSGRSVDQVAATIKVDVKSFNDAGQDQFIEAHAKAAFALNAGDYTDVIESALGWSIFGVKKIVPARERPFSEVKAQLEESLKAQVLNDKLYDLKNKIEDAVAGGANLNDVARDFGLTVETFDAVSRNGLTISGKAVVPAQYKEQVLEQAFNLPEGGDSPMIDIAQGVSLIVHVTKIMPQAVPPLAEIKDLVTRVWTESKQQAKAAALAQDIAKSAKSLEQLTAEAKKNGLTVKVLPAYSRADVEAMKKPEQEVVPAALAKGFSLPKNQAAVAANINGFVVLMLNKVAPMETEKTKEKQQQLQEALSGMMNRDFTKLYIDHQRQVQKVDVNQSILDGIINRAS